VNGASPQPSYAPAVHKQGWSPRLDMTAQDGL
jgi:hypothetical protein